MKVVIVGNGKLGGNLSSALVEEGHDVTVVDSDAERLATIQDKLDVMCIEGNGATAAVQLEASVDSADMLIAATPYDELNLLCCLIAKQLGVKKTAARVRLPDYYGQIHLIREDLGLSMVINPELATADEIARVLIFPSAAKVEVFEKGRLELVEYRLPKDSSIDGMSLAAVYKKVKTKFLICAVQREEEIFIPGGDFVLRSGDRVHIAASHKNLEHFFRSLGFMKEKIKTVMIVGGGCSCYYLASQLLHLGMKVKIIEKDYARCRQLAELLPKAVVIYGDGTDQDLLVKEGVMQTDAFVALTGIDEENIILSLFAGDATQAKVVTKINRDNYLELASGLGLDCLISPKYLATSDMLSYMRSLDNAEGSEIEALYHIVGDQAEAIEFRVRENIPGLVGVPLYMVRLKKNILICAIIRKREIIIPDGNASIKKGDLIVVVSKDYRFSKIKDILE